MNKQIIDRIRVFSRFYVRSNGILNKDIVESGYSLTEAHILNLIDECGITSASEINSFLKLDEGYLSRVIKKLGKEDLIIKKQSSEDKRSFLLSLSEKGREAYKMLDELASLSMESNICHLNLEEQLELATCLERAKELLEKKY